MTARPQRLIAEQPGAVLLIGGGLLLCMLYTAVFAVTGSPIGAALRTAAANVIPLVGTAFVVHRLLTDVIQRGPRTQVIAHLALAPLFSMTWYALTLVCLALFRGAATGDFRVIAFSGVGFVWQLFQGLTVYALVAAITYALRRAPAAPSAPASFERYLLRKDDGLTPVDVEDIVAILGAQDYSEVLTRRGRHLVRIGMADFEARLEAPRFLRVHRSAIINFGQLDHLEPAGGGRMIARMTTGQAIPVSRAGARLLRSFAV
jgi:two-component system LytT family response regulator